MKSRAGLSVELIHRGIHQRAVLRDDYLQALPNVCRRGLTGIRVFLRVAIPGKRHVVVADLWNYLVLRFSANALIGSTCFTLLVTLATKAVVLFCRVTLVGILGNSFSVL
jgi:hypothetical protein